MQRSIHCYESWLAFSSKFRFDEALLSTRLHTRGSVLKISPLSYLFCHSRANFDVSDEQNEGTIDLTQCTTAQLKTQMSMLHVLGVMDEVSFQDTVRPKTQVTETTSHLSK